MALYFVSARVWLRYQGTFEFYRGLLFWKRTGGSIIIIVVVVVDLLLIVLFSREIVSKLIDYFESFSYSLSGMYSYIYVLGVFVRRKTSGWSAVCEMWAGIEILDQPEWLPWSGISLIFYQKIWWCVPSTISHGLLVESFSSSSSQIATRAFCASRFMLRVFSSGEIPSAGPLYESYGRRKESSHRPGLSWSKIHLVLSHRIWWYIPSITLRRLSSLTASLSCADSPRFPEAGQQIEVSKWNFFWLLAYLTVHRSLTPIACSSHPKFSVSQFNCNSRSLSCGQSTYFDRREVPIWDLVKIFRTWLADEKVNKKLVKRFLLRRQSVSDPYRPAEIDE
jgi:hypothetical protein